MNLPSPLEKFRTYMHTEMLFNSTKFTCEKTIRSSVEEAIRIEGSHDTDAALEGSRQKRGYQSLNGIVTATSVDTEKLLTLKCFRNTVGTKLHLILLMNHHVLPTMVEQVEAWKGKV
ncbi:hypothetical protein TNIN_62111 [Trichonephila inaurata madagascariensis]|uniref:Uncharacterized protein n=1 Tax=Trichonephila inaurata madagascariensis TaxID=2747483 RepID=A0A8X7CUD2_9ARAC|nr:hypothetical protein TNIN_62111 [Trichonephila inaurata madagascariensis]